MLVAFAWPAPERPEGLGWHFAPRNVNQTKLTCRRCCRRCCCLTALIASLQWFRGEMRYKGRADTYEASDTGKELALEDWAKGCVS